MTQVTLTMIGLSTAVTVSMEICYRQINNGNCPLTVSSKYKYPSMAPFFPRKLGDFNAGVKRGGWGTATLGDAGGDLGMRRKGTNLRCFYFNLIYTGL